MLTEMLNLATGINNWIYSKQRTN